MSSPSFGKNAGGATSSQPAVPSLRSPSERHFDALGAVLEVYRPYRGNSRVSPSDRLMPYALDAQGRPIFLISTMAMHTQNLQADPRASLFVTKPGASGDRSVHPELR